MPLSNEERQYATMMYEEHAEHARLHEELRASATSLLMALIAGLAASAFLFDRYGRATGIMICAVSALGVLLNVTHHERYEMHVDALRAFREELEKEIKGSALVTIGKNIRAAHEKRLRLHVLWNAVYAITFCIGAFVAYHANN